MYATHHWKRPLSDVLGWSINQQTDASQVYVVDHWAAYGAHRNLCTAATPLRPTISGSHRNACQSCLNTQLMHVFDLSIVT